MRWNSHEFRYHIRPTCTAGNQISTRVVPLRVSLPTGIVTWASAIVRVVAGKLPATCTTPSKTSMFPPPLLAKLTIPEGPCEMSTDPWNTVPRPASPRVSRFKVEPVPSKENAAEPANTESSTEIVDAFPSPVDKRTAALKVDDSTVI